MTTFAKPFNLWAWIRKNQKHLRPPVSNKQLYIESQDAIVFVSGGPNTRNDFHVNPTEELFYQLKGNIALRVRPLDGSKPYHVIIKEGELFLLPRWVPHRPQRPANTVGLIVEFPRGVDGQGQPHKDGLQWYCPKCDHLVHDARFVMKQIDVDLAIAMNAFWDGPESNRTCSACGYIIQRAGTIKLSGGKVKPAGAARAKRGAARATKKGGTRAVKPTARTKTKARRARR